MWGLNGSASRIGKTLTLTVVNPHLTEARETQIMVRGATASSASALVLGGEDVHIHNTFAEPENVKTKTATASVNGSAVSFTFPPSSVVKLTITLS